MAEALLRFSSKSASVCTEALERTVFENYTSLENYVSKMIVYYCIFWYLKKSMTLWVDLAHQCTHTDDPARHNATTSLGTNLIKHLSLQWRRNERDGVSNRWCLDCLFNPLFRHRSKKTSKLRVTGLCEYHVVVSPNNEPVARWMFPFWWLHHDMFFFANCSSYEYS